MRVCLSLPPDLSTPPHLTSDLLLPTTNQDQSAYVLPPLKNIVDDNVSHNLTLHCVDQAQVSSIDLLYSHIRNYYMADWLIFKAGGVGGDLYV